jgi:hypothetical protein
MQEHVDHAGSFDPVTAFVHEDGGVARQRSRRARNIDNPLEPGIFAAGSA